MKVSVYLVNSNNLKRLKSHISSIGQNVIVRSLPNEFINTDAEQYWTDSAGVFTRFTHIDKTKFLFLGDPAKVKEKEAAALVGVRSYPELTDELIQTIADSSAPFFANADPTAQDMDPIHDQEVLYEMIRTGMHAVETATPANDEEDPQAWKASQEAEKQRLASAERLRQVLNINATDMRLHGTDLRLTQIAERDSQANIKLADLAELVNDHEVVRESATLIVGQEENLIPLPQFNALIDLSEEIQVTSEEISFLGQQESLREEMFLAGNLPEVEFEAVPAGLYSHAMPVPGWQNTRTHDIFTPADEHSIQSGVINVPTQSNAAEVMTVPESVDLSGKLIDVDSLLTSIETNQQSIRVHRYESEGTSTPGIEEFGIVPKESPDIAAAETGSSNIPSPKTPSELATVIEVEPEVSAAVEAEPEVSAAVEVVPEVEVEPEVEVAVEVAPEVEVAVEVAPEVEVTPEVAPELEVEPEAELEVEPEAELEVELDLLALDAAAQTTTRVSYTAADMAKDAIDLLQLPTIRSIITDYGSSAQLKPTDPQIVSSIANQEFDEADVDNYPLTAEVIELGKASDEFLAAPPIPIADNEFVTDPVPCNEPEGFVAIFTPQYTKEVDGVEDLVVSSDDDDTDADYMDFGEATAGTQLIPAKTKPPVSIARRPCNPATVLQPKSRTGLAPSVSVVTPGSKLVSQVQQRNSMTTPNFAPKLQDTSQIATVKPKATRGKLNTKRQLGGSVYIFGSTARKSGASLLAYNFACERSREVQKRVLLIDLDFTSAMLSRKVYDANALSMNDSCGIENVLQVSAQDYLNRLDIFTARVCNPQGDEFSFVRSSQEYPYQIREFLNHANFNEFIAALRTVYDVIIIDIGTFKGLTKYKLDLLKSSYTITAIFNCLSQKTVLDSYMVLETIPRGCNLILNNYITTVNPIEIGQATQRKVVGTINTSHAIGTTPNWALLREIQQADVARDWQNIVTELTAR